MFSNMGRWRYNASVRSRLRAIQLRVNEFRVEGERDVTLDEEIPEEYGYNDPIPPRLILRIKTPGTIEHELIRAIGYFMATLLVCAFFYFFFVMRYEMPPNSTGVWVGLIMIATVLCCTQVAFCRCLVLLMLSELFSSKGRWMLMTSVIALAIGGPLVNVARNGEKLGQIGICIQELVKEDAMMLIKQYKGFFKEKFKPFFAAMDKLKDFLMAMNVSLDHIHKVFVEMINSLTWAFGWLRDMLANCNKDDMNGFVMCAKTIHEVTQRCYQTKWFLLCPLLYFLTSFCLNVMMVKMMCQLPERVYNWFIDNIANRILAALDPLVEEFFFQTEFEIQKNFVTEHKLDFNHSMRELLVEMHDIVDLWEIYVDMITVTFTLIAGFFLFQAVYDSLRYICGFRKNPNFDNIYITKPLEDLDRIRSRSGRETIMPLTFRETLQYPTCWTFFFLPGEKPHFLLAAAYVFSNCALPAFILVLDYAVYVTMGSFINFFKANNPTEPMMPGFFSIHTVGVGLMAEAYNSIINTISPVWEGENIAGRWTVCLVRPTIPDFDTYYLILGLVLFSFVTIIFEIYIRRTRHFICSQFFPEADTMRVRALYDLIKANRGAMRFQLYAEYQKMRQSTDMRGVASGLAQVDWQSAREVGVNNWRSQYPLANRILNVVGLREEKCERCAELVHGGEMGDIQKCPKLDCRKIYCNNCFEVVKDRCLGCGTDMRDVEMSKDFYVDSSDEEEENEEENEP